MKPLDNINNKPKEKGFDCWPAYLQHMALAAHYFHIFIRVLLYHVLHLYAVFMDKAACGLRALRIVLMFML
jgi:hypothetical protein